MKLSQATQAIAIAHKAHRPVFLWGQPGIGKSDVVLQAGTALAKDKVVVQYHELQEIDFTPDNAFGIHDVRLSQCEPVDIRGLPIPDTDSGSTRWLPPDWLPHTGREDIADEGILFLDEANSAPASVQAAAYQLVLDRRIGNFSMKPGWSIVLAGNRMTDGGVTFKMPKPLANRMIHLDIEVSMDEWALWAIDHEMPIELVAFIRFRPDLLNTFEDHCKNKREGEAYATPRSWHMAADLVATNPSFDVLMDMLNGTVGKGPAAEFVAFMSVWHKMPSIDNILLDPHRAPVPDDAATLFAVAAALASRATKDNMDAICQYIERVPPEFSVLTVKDSMRRNASCTQSKAFVTWASKNAAIMS